VYLEALIGAVAACCTTASYIPQLKKIWATGEADDLSLKMLLLLAAGLVLWIIYGLIRTDLIIIAANAVSLMLLVCIIYLKLGERKNRMKSSSVRRSAAET
jgi:MtN3 and saliva related transmembrane protein